MTAMPKAPDLEPVTDDKTLAERVYRQLKRALKSGAFEPGQRLTNRAVAGALDVSMTPAREALWRLVTEDALEVAGPKTIIVPHLSRKRYEEITAIRLALEGLAAETATAAADAAFIEELEATHLAFVALRARRDYRHALQMNEKFHFALYERADQPRLLAIIDSLWMSIGPSLTMLYPRFDDQEDGIRPHQDVIRGLKAGDPQRVKAAIEDDIRTGRGKLLALLQERPGEPPAKS